MLYGNKRCYQENARLEKQAINTCRVAMLEGLHKDLIEHGVCCVDHFYKQKQQGVVYKTLIKMFLFYKKVQTFSIEINLLQILLEILN